jgi:hypothetical protein
MGSGRAPASSAGVAYGSRRRILRTAATPSSVACASPSAFAASSFACMSSGVGRCLLPELSILRLPFAPRASR